MKTYRLTPKGYFCTVLMNTYGLTEDQADEVWSMFETFIQQRLKDDYPESSFAAVVFDGNGGEVIGLEVFE